MSAPVVKETYSFADLMSKAENDKSIWQTSKGVFQDTTEIISEITEGTSELVKAFRKGMNALNLQLDEMIIKQKLVLVSTLVEAGLSQEQAIEIIVAQIRN